MGVKNYSLVSIVFLFLALDSLGFYILVLSYNFLCFIPLMLREKVIKK